MLMNKQNTYAFKEDRDNVKYVDEPYINHKIGLSIYNLLMMFEQHDPKINGLDLEKERSLYKVNIKYL